MSKEDAISFDGEVTDVLPGSKFKIKTEAGIQVIGHLSGKIRQNKISIILGDIVTVECSIYDLSKGRIIYRKK